MNDSILQPSACSRHQIVTQFSIKKAEFSLPRAYNKDRERENWCLHHHPLSEFPVRKTTDGKIILVGKGLALAGLFFFALRSPLQGADTGPQAVSAPPKPSGSARRNRPPGGLACGPPSPSPPCTRRQAPAPRPAAPQGTARPGGLRPPPLRGALPLHQLPRTKKGRPSRSSPFFVCYLVSTGRKLTAPPSRAARICSASWLSPQPLPCHRPSAGG